MHNSDEEYLADLTAELFVEHSYSRYLGGTFSATSFKNTVDLQVVELDDLEDPDAEPHVRKFVIICREVA